MAKMKPFRGKKKGRGLTSASAPGAVSCLTLLVLLFGLLFLILYFGFKSA